MTLFQWITLPLLGLVFVWDFIGWARSHRRWNVRFVRCVVWLGIAAAIADPLLAQRIANVLGIGRGADVLLYFLALGFVVACFAFYARLVRLQRQITDIVRYIAIEEARTGRE